MTGEQSGVVLLVVDDASQRETDTVDDDIIEEDDDDDDVVLTEQHVDESSWDDVDDNSLALSHTIVTLSLPFLVRVSKKLSIAAVIVCVFESFGLFVAFVLWSEVKGLLAFVFVRKVKTFQS